MNAPTRGSTCISLGLAALLGTALLSGCATRQWSEEEKRTRLFLAPGTMGLSLMMPSGGYKGTQRLWSERRLRAAAKDGDNAELARRIDESADVNARDNQGWSALTLAVNHGRYDSAVMLLGPMRSSRVEANQITRDEALTIAVQKASVEFVRLLLQNNASPHAANDRRETVLMRAAHVGNAEIMRLLMDRGARVSDVDAEGRTVEYWAREGRCAPCLALIGSAN
jgi:uncharacterized protein